MTNIVMERLEMLEMTFKEFEVDISDELIKEYPNDDRDAT